MENFKSHILVVDDDEGIRSLLKQFLNENGYLVNTASNALKAKEKISMEGDCHPRNNLQLAVGCPPFGCLGERKKK